MRIAVRAVGIVTVFGALVASADAWHHRYYYSSHTTYRGPAAPAYAAMYPASPVYAAPAAPVYHVPYSPAYAPAYSPAYAPAYSPSYAPMAPAGGCYGSSPSYAPMSPGAGCYGASPRGYAYPGGYAAPGGFMDPQGLLGMIRLLREARDLFKGGKDSGTDENVSKRLDKIEQRLTDLESKKPEAALPKDYTEFRKTTEQQIGFINDQLKSLRKALKGKGIIEE